MPVVSEMVHPRGLDFAAQRKVVICRDVHKLAWKDIAKKVRNLQKKKPKPRTCANYYKKFNRRAGRRKSNYEKCGRKAYKLTKEAEQFLVKRLKELRRVGPCTSITLQRELAREKKVKVGADYIRKVLTKRGYRWLPRRQKRVYSRKQRKSRVAFAERVLRMSTAELRKKFSMAMDGTVIPLPPTDNVERLNFCRFGENFMWRRPSETFRAELAGDDFYHNQLPISRALPLWGGISAGGFAVVAFHAAKKFKKEEWAKLVDTGKLSGAVQKLGPVSAHGPWHILCDNEGFLASKEATQAYRRWRVKLWKIPSKSPDLNPIERFWSWLKRKLRALDLADAVAGRPVLGKTAYRERVRRVLSSAKAQTVAKNQANTLRKVCKAVVKKKGGATGW